VLSPWSEQAQVFSVEGHDWAREAGTPGSSEVESVQLNALDALTIGTQAGGPEALAGDYVYGDHREPFHEAGLWGILRVTPPCGSADGVGPLDRGCATTAGASGLGAAPAVAALATLAAGLAALGVRRRRGRHAGVRA
jgi:hypothetical protein